MGNKRNDVIWYDIKYIAQITEIDNKKNKNENLKEKAKITSS